MEAYGSMKKVMEELPNNTFALCNNCYYVNLYYVTSVEGYLVSIGENPAADQPSQEEKLYESPE